ncbi:sugar phosphate isomerase/epimerase family protein [Spirosoma utsteinense]|uniref:Sugar phosphate isomerase/epimerase n=1 Tax=Spirosoma utsteinense TaxID=2585773 RepID=A0ABR6W275_9BACT|nr:sugar phosphate isomerase/epimerase family protein [Spirosoma utsteinense]MBC3785972.1 sugar phosphate isomerase/epimerase [Spirosoma utsteinense]MBC3790670.1 sugar phosphate isomerase/epimerase [Spirosoma utsteinense]
MTSQSRRSALRTTLGGAATIWLASSMDFAKPKPRLSFSTLGCPAWSLDTILKTAVSSGYQGVEFRGLTGQLDLTKCPEFSTAARAAETRRRFAGQGIQIINLGSSAQLHHADTGKRTQHLDEARRFIDLAQQLGCPFVRVFPDQLPPTQSRELTLRLISDGLLELGNYARPRSVTVLLESHGELTRSDLLSQIMTAADHPNVGLIWDVFNMWADSHESPDDVYRKLKKFIRHTHIKDALIENGKHRYVQVGQGEAPLREAISALVADGYTGYYSFEWEKLWHPEIEEPEVAIVQYPKAIAPYF